MVYPVILLLTIVYCAAHKSSNFPDLHEVLEVHEDVFEHDALVLLKTQKVPDVHGEIPTHKIFEFTEAFEVPEKNNYYMEKDQDFNHPDGPTRPTAIAAAVQEDLNTLENNKNEKFSYESQDWYHSLGTGRIAYKPTDPDHYFSNEVHEAKNKDCRPIEKTVYVDECIPYVEKTCYTQQKEVCKDIQEKNCTAVIDELDELICFNMTDLACELEEKVEYKTRDESTKLVCSKSTQTVCDSVYNISVNF